MKSATTGAKDGAIILIMGMVIGMFLAFVLHEYGVREATKAANDAVPPDPKNTPPPTPYFDGKNYIQGKTA